MVLELVWSISKARHKKTCYIHLSTPTWGGKVYRFTRPCPEAPSHQRGGPTFARCCMRRYFTCLLPTKLLIDPWLIDHSQQKGWGWVASNKNGVPNNMSSQKDKRPLWRVYCTAWVNAAFRINWLMWLIVIQLDPINVSSLTSPKEIQWRAIVFFTAEAPDFQL